jgi:UDP-N-acetylmuramoyl-L-alanyl-D-glutamate--2,6-diaminopimelate ligase
MPARAREISFADLESAGVSVPATARWMTARGITADSRKVEAGTIFAALPGAKADGATFIDNACSAGAVAILLPATSDVTAAPVPLLRAADPRRALALIAALVFPGQPPTAVAVTGTAGKTSVAEFTRQIFAALGHRAASLGTLGLVKPDGAVYGSLTTPDPVDLHAALSELAAEGVTHLAFEASSHGLDQRRLDGVTLSAAAFTNLGRDHLDYHATMEEYLAAKLRLFTELMRPGQPAVINLDGERGADVAAAAAARGLRVLTVGANGQALRLLGCKLAGLSGQRLTIAHDGIVTDVNLPLIGTYQVENALVAAGLAIATGEAPANVLAALTGVRGVKGRLEIVGGLRGGLAVVDYAHKPEALAAALAAVRPFASARIICVMGCGGDRDRGKRPIMGRIAAEKADVVIVTDDNPRTEAAATIRAEVLAGAPAAREIGDRAEAIKAAIAMMGPGDVVLVAGKGHETGQVIGSRVVPFSDHDEIAAAMRNET